MGSQSSNSTVERMRMRQLVSGVYDIQALRIATGNRIAASFRMSDTDDLAQSGKPVGKDAGDAKNAKTLKLAVTDYDRITDVYIQKFEGSQQRREGYQSNSPV